MVIIEGLWPLAVTGAEIGDCCFPSNCSEAVQKLCPTTVLPATPAVTTAVFAPRSHMSGYQRPFREVSHQVTKEGCVSGRGLHLPWEIQRRGPGDIWKAGLDDVYEVVPRRVFLLCVSCYPWIPYEEKVHCDGKNVHSSGIRTLSGT